MEGQVVNILIPLKSLSIFVLGTNVEDYLHLGYGYISKEEMQVYSDTYTFPDFGISLSTDIGNVGPRVAAHEFGHLAGLDHSSGLMGKYPGGILWMSCTKMNNEQLQLIHSNYRKDLLNQGDNWEYVRYSSPSAGGVIIKKKN